MPAEVKILVEGQTNADSVSAAGEERTQPTITLVRDGDIIMVVDPGILDSQSILIDALAREGLTVDDVNYVCITHSHIDHYRNIGMFPDAKAIEYYGLWDKTTFGTWSENFSPNIKILHTPGHDYTCITLFVTTSDGVVAICGDVYWRENYPRDPKDDVFASNPEKLKESRLMILKKADWVIPGHGSMYKNNKSLSGASVPVSAKTVNKEAKIVLICKMCGAQMKQKDKCQCRPHICYRCCECVTDCDLCSCSHKK